MKNEQLRFKRDIEIELINDFDVETETIDSMYERFYTGQIVDVDVVSENDGVFECQVPSGEVFYVTKEDVDFL